jgi:hypothetical protein
VEKPQTHCRVTRARVPFAEGSDPCHYSAAMSLPEFVHWCVEFALIALSTAFNLFLLSFALSADRFLIALHRCGWQGPKARVCALCLAAFAWTCIISTTLLLTDGGMSSSIPSQSLLSSNVFLVAFRLILNLLFCIISTVINAFALAGRACQFFVELCSFLWTSPVLSTQTVMVVITTWLAM